MARIINNILPNSSLIPITSCKVLRDTWVCDNDNKCYTCKISALNEDCCDVLVFTNSKYLLYDKYGEDKWKCIGELCDIENARLVRFNPVANIESEEVFSSILIPESVTESKISYQINNMQSKYFGEVKYKYISIMFDDGFLGDDKVSNEIVGFAFQVESNMVKKIKNRKFEIFIDDQSIGVTKMLYDEYTDESSPSQEVSFSLALPGTKQEMMNKFNKKINLRIVKTIKELTVNNLDINGLSNASTYYTYKITCGDYIFERPRYGDHYNNTIFRYNKLTPDHDIIIEIFAIDEFMEYVDMDSLYYLTVSCNSLEMFFATKEYEYMIMIPPVHHDNKSVKWVIKREWIPLLANVAPHITMNERYANVPKNNVKYKIVDNV